MVAYLSGPLAVAGQCAAPVGVPTDVDDLRAVDGEDLEELLRWRGTGSLRWPGQGEPEHYGVAVDLRAAHGRHGPVGEDARDTSR